MSKILLADVDNWIETISEAKNEWVFEILFALGVSEEALINEDGVFELARTEMEDLGIEVTNDLDKEEVIIKYNPTNEVGEDEVVGEWKRPEITRIQEDDGSYYYRITLREWTVVVDDDDDD